MNLLIFCDKENDSKSRTRYTLIDINKSISEYDSGNSNISKTLYNTLQSELKSIKKVVGDPIEQK